jgi:type IV pilus assembly protein PilC
MATFAYQVRDNSGALASGVLQADGLADASRALREQGNVILELREAAQRAVAEAVKAGPIRVKFDDVIFFANQLAVMVDTGVPLSDALDGIAANAAGEGLGRVLTDISDQVKGGTTLSSALAKYPKLFNNLFVSMVKASEASGTMGKMLVRIAAHLQQQRQVIKRVKSACAYPIAMLGFCVLVVVAMLVFILPRFEKIYQGKSATLPLPTRILLGASGFIIHYWPVIIVTLVAGAIVARLLLRRPGGRLFMDQVRLNVPVLGPMFRKACLARSLRTLATMIATGVSVLEALDITADVAGNEYFRRVWVALKEGIQQGAALAEEMRKFPLLPKNVSQMVSAGEKSGKLGIVLDRVATFCEEDLDTSVRTVTSFIEPAMIIIMGFIVGGIAMSLLLPVFSLSKIVAH